jgi:molybdopterin-guanine dinucleotide biosynthesis protein
LGHDSRAARRGRTQARGISEEIEPVDLVLVDGCKDGSHPKVEVYRAAVDKPPLYPEDAAIVAIASDELLLGAKIPVVNRRRGHYRDHSPPMLALVDAVLAVTP